MKKRRWVTGWPKSHH